MPFSELDTTVVARSLSQITDRHGDLADAFFERSERLELPPAQESAGVRLWRQQGFAIRLIRDGQSWLASRDGVAPALFSDALRQVARVMPAAPYSAPSLRVGPGEELHIPVDLFEFPGRVTHAIRRRLAGFPLHLRVFRHRRWLRVVRTQMAPDQQTESFYSYEAETPWSRFGGLLAELDERAVERVAASLTFLFRSREAPAAGTAQRPVVLGPSACAVMLHEAVAHALETDTLALGGRVDAAIGVRVGSPLLDVVDSPGDGPAGVQRSTDDEGTQVVRRWLLRAGVVEQPLADLSAAYRSPHLLAGAGRRADYLLPPVPRSSHLELLAGESSFEGLIGDVEDGFFFPEAAKGRLDPLTGGFRLDLPGGRRIEGGALADAVGPCRLQGRVTELLSAVTGVGEDRVSAGAGWCAKGGIRLPVWATVPALRLESAEVIG